jgi:hypothetical protein
MGKYKHKRDTRTAFDRSQSAKRKTLMDAYHDPAALYNNPEKEANNLQFATAIAENQIPGDIIICDTDLFQTTKTLIKVGIKSERIIIIEHSKCVYNKMITSSERPKGVVIVYDEVTEYVRQCSYGIGAIYADYTTSLIEPVIDLIPHIMRGGRIVFAYSVCTRSSVKGLTAEKKKEIFRESISECVSKECLESYTYRSMLYELFILEF